MIFILSHQKRVITFDGERVRISSLRRLKVLNEGFQSAQRGDSNSFTIESYDSFLMGQNKSHFKIIDFN